MVGYCNRLLPSSCIASDHIYLEIGWMVRLQIKIIMIFKRTYPFSSTFGFFRPLISRSSIIRYKCSVPRVRYGFQKRSVHMPADDPNFISIVDNPPTLIRSGRRHGPGLIILGVFLFTVSHMRSH